jgi:hypothetical protein
MNFFMVVFLLIVPFAAFANTTLNSNNSESNTPTKVPFEPKLVYSENDALCKNVLLNYTKKYFKGSSLVPETKSKIVYLKWHELQTPKYARIHALGKIEITFEDNKKATLLRWDEPFNWRGDTYSAFLYPTTFRKLHFQDNNISSIKQLKKEGIEIYPDASFAKDYNNSKFHIYSSQWRDVDIFTFGGKYYYENKLNEYWSVGQQFVGTLEILGNGTLRPVCVVQVKSKAKNPLLKKKNFAAFLDALNNMTGRYGNCGTLGSGNTILSLNIPTTLEKIAYRPWASPLILYRSKQLSVIPAFLDEWGHHGLWNYDVYQRYLRVKDKAKQDLIDYYMQTFGVNKQTAQSYAQSAYNQILSAHFNVPYYGLSPQRNDLLRKALLEGKSVREVEPMLVGKWKGPKKNAYYEQAEPTLFYALGHPKLVLLLLSKGSDVNSSNAFGKTALMYAAQYNFYKSAKLLLKAGIDVNRETVMADDTCSYTIRRQKVTALDYAVRYADSKFVKLLLDYGANKNLKDSDGKTAFDWIELFKDENKKLTPLEIATMKKLLKPISDKERKIEAKKNIQLAQAAYRKKELKKASAYYKKALEYEPKDATAISDLALVYYKLGNYPLAVKMAQYSAFYSKDPQKSASGYYNMGLICTAAKPNPCLRVEGRCYCIRPPLYYFLRAHMKSPSIARAKKVLEILSQTKSTQSWQRYLVSEHNDKKIKFISLGFRDYIFSKKVLDKNMWQSKNLKLIDTLQADQTKYYVYQPKNGRVHFFAGDDPSDSKICYDKELKHCLNIKIVRVY